MAYRTGPPHHARPVARHVNDAPASTARASVDEKTDGSSSPAASPAASSPAASPRAGGRRPDKDERTGRVCDAEQPSSPLRGRRRCRGAGRPERAHQPPPLAAAHFHDAVAAKTVKIATPPRAAPSSACRAASASTAASRMRAAGAPPTKRRGSSHPAARRRWRVARAQRWPSSRGGRAAAARGGGAAAAAGGSSSAGPLVAASLRAARRVPRLRAIEHVRCPSFRLRPRSASAARLRRGTRHAPARRSRRSRETRPAHRPCDSRACAARVRACRCGLVERIERAERTSTHARGPAGRRSSVAGPARLPSRTTRTSPSPSRAWAPHPAVTWPATRRPRPSAIRARRPRGAPSTERARGAESTVDRMAGRAVLPGRTRVAAAAILGKTLKIFEGRPARRRGACPMLGRARNASVGSVAGRNLRARVRGSPRPATASGAG